MTRNIPLAPNTSVEYIGMFLRTAKEGWHFFAGSLGSKAGTHNKTSFQQHGNVACYLLLFHSIFRNRQALHLRTNKFGRGEETSVS